jgi:hypothetical protein
MVAILLASLFVLAFGCREYSERIANLSIGIFGHLGKYAIKPEAIGEWSGIAVGAMLRLILPMALTCAFARRLAAGCRVGFK